MLSLKWVTKNQGGGWLDLDKVNLSKINAAGVYMIWHGGNPGKVVRVGQGDIADRLCCHRDDPDITAYRPHRLYVTWASVPANQRGGVERFLAQTWKPLVGDRWPDVAPIAVNSPW